MAFNFNWSPLFADTSRARDMLTSALNKSPKPPIIVDDIIVNELNLGSVPPELEILEIGDLAEDRFRGIFKMSYTGDAYLTLKTRVQANPLNTYLSNKPSFASPQPLAAASGLTIPLQITLSDIRLSGFVILVFSKQKGITLVFRNDPLESLKVSSTFDSIPFVRDYLQKEIEGQLRILFMEDLPAIIHRLSLRIWSPDYQHQDREMEQRLPTGKDTEKPIDPLSSPPQPAYDAFGSALDENDLTFLSPEQTQVHATFSQKNLLKLAALTECHRTLALFTPPIRDAVFRAWAGAAERAGTISAPAVLSPHHTNTHVLTRRMSAASSVSGSAYSQSDNGASTSSRFDSSSVTSYSFGASTSKLRGNQARKRKHRVVNLRKPKPEDAPTDEGAEIPSTPLSGPLSTSDYSISEEREGELITPPDSPEKKTPRARAVDSLKMHSSTEIVSPQPRQTPSRKLQHIMDPGELEDSLPELSLSYRPEARPMQPEPTIQWQGDAQEAELRTSQRPARPRPRRRQHSRTQEAAAPAPEKIASPVPIWSSSASMTGGILEQAWLAKMAGEIQSRVAQEKLREASAAGEAKSEGSATDALPSRIRPLLKRNSVAGNATGPSSRAGSPALLSSPLSESSLPSGHVRPEGSPGATPRPRAKGGPGGDDVFYAPAVAAQAMPQAMPALPLGGPGKPSAARPARPATPPPAYTAA